MQPCPMYRPPAPAKGVEFGSPPTVKGQVLNDFCYKAIMEMKKTSMFSKKATENYKHQILLTVALFVSATALQKAGSKYAFLVRTA